MFCDNTESKLFSVIINSLFCVIAACMLALLFGRIYLVSCGKATGSYQGFDVDSKENIYVGTMKQIRKIKDGKIVESISPPTNRAYCFCIENDTLLIGCASDSKGGIYDLHGNEISYGGIRYKDVEKKAKGKTILFNGHEYKIHTSIFESYKISRDGVIVYQSDNSFFDGFSYFLSFMLAIFLFGILVLIKLAIWNNYRTEAGSVSQSDGKSNKP